MSSADSPWPLVLYGPSGTGKTALAETIASRLKTNCLNISASEFRRQFLFAAATRSVSSFRRRMQNGSALLLDHLVLQADEEPLIRELVQLCEYYLQNRLPLLVTMSTAPWLLPAAFRHLRSRLSTGLVIGINRPGRLARQRIALQLMQRFDLKILDEDMPWFADQLPETAPQINRLISELALRSDDRLITKQAVRESTRQSDNPVDRVRQITSVTCRQFGQRLNDVMGKSRRREVVRARSVAMYLSREILKTSFREIGQLIGNRDASTVRHACQQTAQRIGSDMLFAKQTAELTNRINRLIDTSNPTSPGKERDNLSNQ